MNSYKNSNLNVTKVTNVLTNILCTILLILALTILALKVLGYGFFTVKTGSMAEVYPIGSIIVVQPTEFDSIHVGDVISFYISDDTIVTHRVVEVDTGSNTFTTQGDENDSPDDFEVPYSNVIGKPILSIKRLGYVYIFASTTKGKVVLLGLAVLGVVTSRIHNTTEKS